MAVMVRLLSHFDGWWWRHHAGDDKAQFFTLRTAKALAMTALDLLLQPEAMQRVKQEFNEAKLMDDKMSNGVWTLQPNKETIDSMIVSYPNKLLV